MPAENQRHLQTPLGQVEYLDVGTGVPVLYFHGTGAGNDAALLLDQSLLRSHCRLIIPNRPGYAGTTLGVRGSAEFCAELAARLLDHLAIDRVAVVGTSGGGMIAACFARRYPARTAALVLQCAESHRWAAGKWLPHGLGPALFLFRYPVFRPLLRWQNSRYAKAAGRRPSDALRRMSGNRFSELRHNADVLRQMAQLAAMTAHTAVRPAGIENDWAILVGNNGIAADTVKCPTLVIHDREDPLVPFRHAEWSHSCIPQSHLLDIHAGGHLIWYGQDFAPMHEHRVTFLHQCLKT